MQTPEKSTTFLTTSGPQGEEIQFPLGTIRGSTEGPTLVVVAGLHGSEYVGIDAAKRLFEWVEPERLSGTLKIVPCVNIPGFYGLAMHVNPVDDLNPNRCFPGDAGGSYTERMIDLLWREVVLGADAVVDLHGGDLEEELVDFSQVRLSGDEAVDQRSEGVARALDMPFYIRLEKPEVFATTGRLCQIAGANSISAVLVESGSHGVLDEARVSVNLKGLKNVLSYLEMIDEQQVLENPQATLLDREVSVTTPVNGLWHPLVAMGETIRKGQTIGTMRDFFGNDLSVIVSDQDGVVLGGATVLARRENEMLIVMGCSS